MWEQVWSNLADLLTRGGWVMWPLLALSVIALTLIFERCWFWLLTHYPGRERRIHRLAEYLRQGKTEKAAALVDGDRSVYGRIVQQVLAESDSDAVVIDAVETQRPRMDRFMPTLGTIITAAPLLGILGTVTGIIRSFRILSADQSVTDPSQIGSGIAEALLTTVVGLAIAIVVLFPYNAFRAQMDRALGRAEVLVAAARQGSSKRGQTTDEPLIAHDQPDAA